MTTTTTSRPTPVATPVATQWDLWTTTVRLVVAQPAALDDAAVLLRDFLAAIEEAVSRFRVDSQICQIARSDSETHHISSLLSDVLRAALTAAAVSDGRVDPTVGTVIARLDRPLAGPGSALRTAVSTKRRTTWRDVKLQGQILAMPAHTLLDLGATGKAFAADRAAQLIADTVGCGVLVSLGGDLRVSGPLPECGWTVLVQDGADQPDCLVDLLGSRAIATSSTLHRRLGADRVQHVFDPLALAPIEPAWRTVSVAAQSCVQANTWSTAALVEGVGAPGMLAATGLPARLVGVDGRVIRLGGWPA